MPHASPLTDAELAAALERLPEWSRDGATLSRTFEMTGFRQAIAMVNQVADAAEAANHHPDISITRYRHVTFTLTTHAASAITARDTELAAEIDRIAARIGGA